MSIHIPDSLRQAVIQRTQERCEYCHKPPVTFFPHEVDHVIASKHGGQTALANLAYACFECNRYKGSDVASIDPQTNEVTALFNPRTQQWAEHFRFDNGQIVPLTPHGRVTVFLLRLNDKSRVEERIALNIGTESYEGQ